MAAVICVLVTMITMTWYWPILTNEAADLRPVAYDVCVSNKRQRIGVTWLLQYFKLLAEAIHYSMMTSVLWQ